MLIRLKATLNLYAPVVTSISFSLQHHYLIKRTGLENKRNDHQRKNIFSLLFKEILPTSAIINIWRTVRRKYLLMLKPKRLINGASVFSFRCITTAKDCVTKCGENRFIMKKARIAWWCRLLARTPMIRWHVPPQPRQRRATPISFIQRWFSVWLTWCLAFTRAQTFDCLIASNCNSLVFAFVLSMLYSDLGGDNTRSSFYHLERWRFVCFIESNAVRLFLRLQ